MNDKINNKIKNKQNLSEVSLNIILKLFNKIY